MRDISDWVESLPLTNMRGISGWVESLYPSLKSGGYFSTKRDLENTFMSGTKKILIVEDDKNISEELAVLLKNAGYDTDILADFANTKELLLETDADLILLDINIPYINGEMLLKELRKVSDIPVIMVTSRNTEMDEVLSMSYGADDYITKPYNPTLLLLRINNIFKRTGNQSEEVSYKGLTVDMRKGVLRGIFSNDTSDTTDNDINSISDDKLQNSSGDVNEILLTKNEMLIFSYLLNNRNRIVTRDELITDLWNNNEFVGDNTLTVNISRLRSKLKSAGIDDAIDTRKGQGYILQ